MPYITVVASNNYLNNALIRDVIDFFGAAGSSVGGSSASPGPSCASSDTFNTHSIIRNPSKIREFLLTHLQLDPQQRSEG